MLSPWTGSQPAVWGQALCKGQRRRTASPLVWGGSTPVWAHFTPLPRECGGNAAAARTHARSGRHQPVLLSPRSRSPPFIPRKATPILASLTRLINTALCCYWSRSGVYAAAEPRRWPPEKDTWSAPPGPRHLLERRSGFMAIWFAAWRQRFSIRTADCNCILGIQLSLTLPS